MIGRVLVTGGFGYVGGRVAVALAQAGWTVRLGTRTEKAVPGWLPAAQVSTMDVERPSSVAAAVRGVDAVVHLAAMNEIDCARDPARALIVNTVGATTVLEKSIEAGVKAYLYFSTAHVYRAPLVGVIDESTVPRPVHPYALTHKAAEDFVLAARDQGRVDGVVVRLSNGFGAPAHPDVERWTLLVNDLCRQAVRDRRLTLRSSGLQQRDFVTLHDVGRAVTHLLRLDPDQKADGLFNLGDRSWSVIEMVDRIVARCQAVLGFTPVVDRPAPGPGEEIQLLQYDSSKLRRTGFAPSSEVDAEIDATLRVCADAARVAA